MATFEIDGKEYELKITFEAVKRLNNEFEGGSYELIGRALAMDVSIFPKVVYAALIHTGEKFTLKKIEKAIDELFEKEVMTFETVQRILVEVVAESFFYKPTVQKLLNQDPGMKQAYEQVIKSLMESN